MHATVSEQRAIAAPLPAAMRLKPSGATQLLNLAARMWLQYSQCSTTLSAARAHDGEGGFTLGPTPTPSANTAPMRHRAHPQPVQHVRYSVLPQGHLGTPRWRGQAHARCPHPAARSGIAAGCVSQQAGVSWALIVCQRVSWSGQGEADGSCATSASQALTTRGTLTRWRSCASSLSSTPRGAFASPAPGCMAWSTPGPGIHPACMDRVAQEQHRVLHGQVRDRRRHPGPGRAQGHAGRTAVPLQTLRRQGSRSSTGALRAWASTIAFCPTSAWAEQVSHANEVRVEQSRCCVRFSRPACALLDADAARAMRCATRRGTGTVPACQ